MRRIDHGPRFLPSLVRLGIKGGSDTAKAVVATTKALAANELPSPFDYAVARPPVGARLWVRRVARENVWLFFVFDEARVLIVQAVNVPPIPDEP